MECVNICFPDHQAPYAVNGKAFVDNTLQYIVRRGCYGYKLYLFPKEEFSNRRDSLSLPECLSVVGEEDEDEDEESCVDAWVPSLPLLQATSRPPNARNTTPTLLATPDTSRPLEPPLGEGGSEAR